MNIKLIIKGFIIGIAKIIPGVSGAVLALSLGLYDQGIDAITNFFNNKKKNTKLLLNVGFGIMLAIITFSNIINYSLANYYHPTMLLFLGLICGGIYPLFKKVKKNINNLFIIIISFIFIMILSITNINNHYILQNNFLEFIIFFLGGLLEAIGTIFPGISGTALLIISGLYEHIINSLCDLSNILKNAKIIIPFILGILLGIIIFAKLINYLLKKHSEKTFSLVIGISIGSIFLLIIKIFIIKIKIPEIIIGSVLFILGIYISKKLDN